MERDKCGALYFMQLTYYSTIRLYYEFIDRISYLYYLCYLLLIYFGV